MLNLLLLFRFTRCSSGQMGNYQLCQLKKYAIVICQKYSRNNYARNTLELTGQCPKNFEDFIVRIRAKN